MQITKQEFDEVFKSNDNVEIFTQEYINNYVESNMELLQKSEAGEDLEDFEKSELNTVTENIQSFQKVEVFDREKDQYDIQKSIYYVREKQVDWDEIEKSEDPEIMKSRGGTYKNTALNRKMGRVGQKFGGTGSKESEMMDFRKEAGLPPKKKEYYQMTKKEYKNSDSENSEAYHRNGIVNALRNGKSVPEEVLKEYPELKDLLNKEDEDGKGKSEAIKAIKLIAGDSGMNSKVTKESGMTKTFSKKYNIPVDEMANMINKYGEKQ